MILSLIILTSFSFFLILNFYNKNNNFSPVNLLMNSSIVSGIILAIWFLNGLPSFIINLNWLTWGLQNFSLSVFIDFPLVIFSAVGLFVTWSIIEFSQYYMDNDPNKSAFINTLILFLLFMLILVSSNNLFMLFIGWEGVGIMSFILIGWWFTRSDANSSALQAIIYNRIGDSGMVLFMVIAMLNFNSWNLNEIIFFSSNSTPIYIAILGIILAAAGKSAQFSLHPWLPAAMEGPTPVSALLHSSTMVVAGVFLLFRCSSIINHFPWALALISILGAITALFTASIALTQYDIKKIVAYSTTSQLGLMVVAIGINIPELALFHICTHAFFKALLFLCSGSIIHNFNNEQDIRKMGNSSSSLPITTSCIIIGSLALCGLPYLAGYYSKDLILEASQYNISNGVSVLLAMIATLMTAIYSLRLIYFIAFTKTNTSPINPISEENPNLTNPLIRLASGVFLSGWIISVCLINNETMNIPLLNKITPLIMLLYASVSILNNLFNNINLHSQSTINFLSNNWFYVNIFHSNSIIKTLKLSIEGVLRTLDQGWTSFLGATTINKTTIFLSNYLLNIHNSLIPSYFKFLISLIFIVIIFILVN
uniref:NADH-ubiquinone oxidoreductase chain 5 n=1 Tax=Ophiura albida TaxID=72672 RepID=B2FDM8_OPHAL|nr:NADH dehydrogenase subunit 5 [Ophiura albida]CAL50583.1 NADH dehydrogenase subunit 5 [Ophiura albida]